jgi:hypothetical protein
MREEGDAKIVGIGKLWIDPESGVDLLTRFRKAIEASGPNGIVGAYFGIVRLQFYRTREAILGLRNCLEIN